MSIFRKKKKLINKVNAEVTEAELEAMKTVDIKAELTECDCCSDELKKQLPVKCTFIRMIPGKDRSDYWLVQCETPIKYQNTEINYVILATRFVGEKIKKGMGSHIVNMAYVIDETLIKDETLEFNKCEYVAICYANEL